MIPKLNIGHDATTEASFEDLRVNGPKSRAVLTVKAPRCQQRNAVQADHRLGHSGLGQSGINTNKNNNTDGRTTR